MTRTRPPPRPAAPTGWRSRSGAGALSRRLWSCPFRYRCPSWGCMPRAGSSRSTRRNTPRRSPRRPRDHGLGRQEAVMYLNIGGGNVVRKNSIVAICDIDNTTFSRSTRELLAAAEKAGEVINAAEDLPRSFILCEERGTRRVWLSSLSSAALSRR